MLGNTCVILVENSPNIGWTGLYGQTQKTNSGPSGALD